MVTELQTVRFLVVPPVPPENPPADSKLLLAIRTW